MKVKVILISLLSIVFSSLSSVLLYKVVCSNSDIKTLATIYVFIGYAISVLFCCISYKLSNKMKSDLISFIQAIMVLNLLGNIVYLVYISRGIM